MVRSRGFADPFKAINAIDSIECGEEALSHFMFEPGYRNLNHGSFGTYPRLVQDALHFYQAQAEANPDRYIRYTHPTLLDKTRQIVADYLKAPVETCVLIPNATTGLNTILRNLVYEHRDVIVYSSVIYGAIEKTVEYLIETTPVRGHKIPLQLPLSDDAICEAFAQAFDSLRAAGSNPRLAIFDTIASMPGIRFPFERLTTLCANHDVFSCIDGAHGIGQIPISLSTLNPDFFVTNCHKWLHTPRACAILYVPVRHQPLMRSTIPTSHGFQVQHPAGAPILSSLPPTSNSAFVANFEYVGTLDSTPYLTIPAALAWRSKLTFGSLRGESAVQAYTQHLAQIAGQAVATHLATDVLHQSAPSAFVNVRLPISFQDDAAADLPTAVAIAQWMSRLFLDEYQTFLAILLHADAFWVRLSAQVYLTIDDFTWAARVLEEVCARVRRGEWKGTSDATVAGTTGK